MQVSLLAECWGGPTVSPCSDCTYPSCMASPSSGLVSFLHNESVEWEGLLAMPGVLLSRAVYTESAALIPSLQSNRDLPGGVDRAVAVRLS